MIRLVTLHTLSLICKFAPRSIHERHTDMWLPLAAHISAVLPPLLTTIDCMAVTTFVGRNRRIHCHHIFMLKWQLTWSWQSTPAPRLSKRSQVSEWPLQAANMRADFPSWVEATFKNYRTSHHRMSVSLMRYRMHTFPRVLISAPLPIKNSQVSTKSPL